MSYTNTNISLVESGKLIDIKDGEFKKVGFWKGLKISLSRSAKKDLVERIVAFSMEVLEEIFSNNNAQGSEYSFCLEKAIVKKYAKSKHSLVAIKKLDHLIISKQYESDSEKQIESKDFLHISNRKNFSRWDKCGFPKEIFFKHPDFANFLLDTYIGNSMGTWGDQIILVDGQPHILVDTKPKHWEEVRGLIEMRYHPKTHSKRIFRCSDNQLLEYLGGGQGLVKCDRYHGEKVPVVTSITKKEMQHVLKLGREYCRPSKVETAKEESSKPRDHVLQVVTTKRDWKKVKFSDLLEGPDHSHLRLILPNGDVKTVGYLPINKNKNVLAHGKGAIASLDFGDLFRSGKQYVTNIAIDLDEAENFESIIERIRENKDIIYNKRRQNCCNLVKYVLSTLKLADLPEPIRLSSFLRNILVHGKTSDKPLNERLITQKSKDETKQNIFVRVASAVLIAFISLLLKPITVFLGDRPFKKFEDQKDTLVHKISRFFKWLIEPFAGNIPAQTIAWQLTVDGTEVLPKKKKIAISLAILKPASDD